MAVITGLDFAIGSNSTAHRFLMEISNEVKEYIASGGQMGVGRKCGIDEWRGVATAYGYLPPVASKPGSDFTFTGSVDGTYGFTGTAYAEAWDIIANIEEGEYLAYSLQFSRNGALTVGSAAATDSTNPSPPCFQNASLTIGSAVTDVTFWRLRLSCPGFPYVSSSTSGGRKRKRGAWDMELEYHCYNQNPAELPVRGTFYNVKPYCTAALYYDLNWMTPVTIVPYVNPESRRPVNTKVTMRSQGSNGTDMGYAKTPEAVPVTLWPFA